MKTTGQFARAVGWLYRAMLAALAIVERILPR